MAYIHEDMVGEEAVGLQHFVTIITAPLCHDNNFVTLNAVGLTSPPVGSQQCPIV